MYSQTYLDRLQLMKLKQQLFGGYNNYRSNFVALKVYKNCIIKIEYSHKKKKR